MQRSTFKVLFYVKRQSEKHGQVPVMGRITINGTMSQFSCKLTVRSTLWDAKPTRPLAKVSNRSASTRSWRISRPISANSTSVSATGTHTLRPKRSATPSSVWAMIAACCYRPSTNILRSSASVWAKTALIPPTRITVCVADVLPLSSNTNTTSRTFLSKS